MPPKSTITLSVVKMEDPQESPTEWQMPHGAEDKNPVHQFPAMPAAYCLLYSTILTAGLSLCIVTLWALLALEVEAGKCSVLLPGGACQDPPGSPTRLSAAPPDSAFQFLPEAGSNHV